jgi:AcrR family transcriptional regulator
LKYFQQEVQLKEEYLTYHILGKTYELPYINKQSKTKERILMQSTILFAQNGYSSITMREIAESIGIRAASLYNHFSSKEVLWNAVLDHSMTLFDLYIEQLNVTLENASGFEEILEIMYTEPKKLNNLFTCFAFSLLCTDQIRDERTGVFFKDTFLAFGIEFHKKWFDICVERAYVKPFDTWSVASFFINSVVVAINLKVQELMGRSLPFDPSTMFAEQQKFILKNISG